MRETGPARIDISTTDDTLVSNVSEDAPEAAERTKENQKNELAVGNQNERRGQHWSRSDQLGAAHKRPVVGFGVEHPEQCGGSHERVEDSHVA